MLKSQSFKAPKPKPKKPKPRDLLCEGEEATIAIPVIVPPAEKEAALRAVPAEKHHVTVDADHTGISERYDGKLPL